jgi:O-antigen/teichoic acid export membrane protein
MEFRQLALTELAGSFLVLAAGLIILLWFPNVWALAAYALLAAFAKMVISYVLFPWKPRIQFDSQIFKSIATFSGSIIAINILNYLFNNLDKGVVGKLLGVEALGYYARAYFLALIPVIYIFNVITPVILPAFRELSADRERFQRAFLKTVSVFSVIAVSMGVICFVFSKSIVLIIYGEKWLPALPIFKVLLLFGVSKGIVTVCAQVFFLKEKPWMVTLTTAVMVACFSAFCLPMTASFHAVGTAWAVVISALVSHILSFILAVNLVSKGRLGHTFSKFVPLSWREERG